MDTNVQVSNSAQIAQNQLLCADLFSQKFQFYMDLAFEKCNTNNVQKITRAYYVYLDLKAGVDLNIIEKFRLEPFHSFLWGYILNFPEDTEANKLWEIVDTRLAICT